MDSRIKHVQLMASYNEWMNTKLYSAAMQLPDEELARDRKAFFKSILGTLNHLVVADTIWLNRYRQHPANFSVLNPVQGWPMPTSLDQILFDEVQHLYEHRKIIDKTVQELAASVSERDLDVVLHYSSTKGIPFDKNFFSLLMHFFNHQTHHRGQVTTLLSQQGIDVGVTDLVMLIPEVETGQTGSRE